MEDALSLLENKVISRAKSYMVIVLVPLVEKPKPYCLGMYPVAKGSDSATLSSVGS